ncbi:ankyrin repeat domain-containing protein [Stakelama tenebrarum]|uniref:Ankyrin repeat domain-containing protein n=1 Tax=Stakelama tenebrarum TaxID=2711215 RepID=A0A6G6Y0F2_9SPHN|nr:ankyrin repeat domain-containing protein [Sphingosinithalassobacter tenebrarum]QIG78390.1 ankyrin repeat domain-containing protein [Sphingosinithalassobacter tenebrarum]
MSDLRKLHPQTSPDLVRRWFDAATLGDADTIAALLRAGADIEARDERGYTALILASYNGHEAATHTLVSAGARLDGGDGEGGNTALMGVAFKGHVEIARLLIDAGADVNARNADGQTALMTAAMFDRKEIVDLLLRQGADPTIEDGAGNSAMSLAAMQGNIAMAERMASAPPGGI